MNNITVFTYRNRKILEENGRLNFTIRAGCYFFFYNLTNISPTGTPKKSTFTYYLRWWMFFLDVLCSMPSARQIRPYSSKSDMLCRGRRGQGGAVTGANARASVVHCSFPVPTAWQCSEVLFGSEGPLFTEHFRPCRNACVAPNTQCMHI